MHFVVQSANLHHPYPALPGNLHQNQPWNIWSYSWSEQQRQFGNPTRNRWVCSCYPHPVFLSPAGIRSNYGIIQNFLISTGTAETTAMWRRYVDFSLLKHTNRFSTSFWEPMWKTVKHTYPHSESLEKHWIFHKFPSHSNTHPTAYPHPEIRFPQPVENPCGKVKNYRENDKTGCGKVKNKR